MFIVKADVKLDENNLASIVKQPPIQYPHVQLFKRPDDVYKVMTDVFSMDKDVTEKVYLIAMNTKLMPTAFFLLNQGIINECVVDTRGLMMRLLLCNASGFILVHNHVSGEVTPSHDDIILTAGLKKSSRLMGISFLEHLIVGTLGRFFSFYDEVWNKEDYEEESE